MGTKKESFVELTERISRTTGGVSVYPFISSVKGSPDPVAFLMVRVLPVPGDRSWLCCYWRMHHVGVWAACLWHPKGLLRALHSRFNCG